MAADIPSLEAAFHAWNDGLNTGDLDAFWQAFDAEAEILDEDFPWRMDLDDFKDHIAFHAGGKGMWESFEWKPRETHFKVFGDTGHVSGFSTFRGKPRDAGFRQRFIQLGQQQCLAGPCFANHSHHTGLSVPRKFQQRIIIKVYALVLKSR